jgi:hypothetical protein
MLTKKNPHKKFIFHLTNRILIKQTQIPFHLGWFLFDIRI